MFGVVVCGEKRAESLENSRRKATVRQFLRFVRSPKIVLAGVSAVAGLALLFPVFLIVIDHHGIERLADHQHALPSEGPLPPHVHGFEINHVHSSTFAPAMGPSVPSVVPSVPLLAIVLALVQMVGLPFAGWRDPSVLRPEQAIYEHQRLTAQRFVAPPTRPPTLI